MLDFAYRGSSIQHRASLLDTDIYNFANQQRTEQLRYYAADEHFLAHRIGEEQHQVVGVHAVDDDKQCGRQSEQHDTREAAFAGEGLDLAPDLEALADQVADLVEDFGQVTTRLTLQDDRRGEELEVQIRNAHDEIVKGFFERLAEVLFFEGAA